MTYEDFISKFETRRPTKTGHMVPCPSHDDSPKTPSLSVGKSKDGGVILKCFAGCTAQQVVESLGLKMRDLFSGEKPVNFRPPVRTAPPPSTEKPVIECVYSYRDALNQEVYQAIRLRPKSFRQRHQENGKWVWTMDGVTRVLYRLPEVLNAKQVIICEGEKDADNLTRLGFTATCNVGGAGKWMDGYTESLKDKEVILCGDNDDAGRKHMELVFDSIAGSATVKIIKLPESIKDASDFITTFGTDVEAKSAFDDLIAAAYPHIKGTRLPIYSISEIESDYKRFVRNMETNSFSLSSWLPSLVKIRPLVPGELVFIVGDTGTGKTGLLQNIALAALPLPTLLFELELPKEMMFERFASIATKFTGVEIESAYRNYPEETLAEQIGAKYQKLFLCPESRLTLTQIEAYIMRAELKMGERPRVVLIDYIQLIGGEGVNRREKVSDIAEGLKVMAKATQTICIVTSQVARPQNIKEDEAWEPHLHSAKESGSIESSCGVLIGAWQDTKGGGLNLKVLKSTKGGTGTFVKCNFDGARMIISERSKISDADVPNQNQYND